MSKVKLSDFLNRVTAKEKEMVKSSVMTSVATNNVTMLSSLANSNVEEAELQKTIVENLNSKVGETVAKVNTMLDDIFEDREFNQDARAKWVDILAEKFNIEDAETYEEKFVLVNRYLEANPHMYSLITTFVK